MAFNYNRKTEFDNIIEKPDRARAHVDCLSCVFVSTDSLAPFSFAFTIRMTSFHQEPFCFATNNFTSYLLLHK